MIGRSPRFAVKIVHAMEREEIERDEQAAEAIVQHRLMTAFSMWFPRTCAIHWPVKASDEPAEIYRLVSDETDPVQEAVEAKRNAQSNMVTALDARRAARGSEQSFSARAGGRVCPQNFGLVQFRRGP